MAPVGWRVFQTDSASGEGELLERKLRAGPFESRAASLGDDGDGGCPNVALGPCLIP